MLHLKLRKSALGWKEKYFYIARDIWSDETNFMFGTTILTPPNLQNTSNEIYKHMLTPYHFRDSSV